MKLFSRLAQTLLVLIVLVLPVGIGAFLLRLVIALQQSNLPFGYHLAGGIIGWGLVILIGLGFIRLLFPAARRLHSIWRPEQKIGGK